MVFSILLSSNSEIFFVSSILSSFSISSKFWIICSFKFLTEIGLTFQAIRNFLSSILFSVSPSSSCSPSSASSLASSINLCYPYVIKDYLHLSQMDYPQDHLHHDSLV